MKIFLPEIIGIAGIIIPIFFIFMGIWVISGRKVLGSLKEFIDVLLSLCCLFVSIVFNFGNIISILCFIILLFNCNKFWVSGESLNENKKEVIKN